MIAKRKLLDGTWSVDGVRHYVYRTTNTLQGETRAWFNSACGQHASEWGYYDFAGRWRGADGGVLPEPRLMKACVTCLECLVNPIPEK